MASCPLAALRGKNLRRMASCIFVPFVVNNAAAWLRALSGPSRKNLRRMASCIFVPFVEKPPPHGFVFIRGPSW